MTNKNIDMLFKDFHIRSKHPIIDKLLEDEINNGIQDKFIKADNEKKVPDYNRAPYSRYERSSYQRTDLNLENIAPEISISFNR